MEIEILKKIRSRASKLKKTIILPESKDERILKAAEILLKENIASVITLGNEDEIRNKALELDINLAGIRIIDPEKSNMLSDFSNIYYNLRRKKETRLWRIEQARETLKNNLFFAAMMLKESMADGSAAGSISTTADVLKAGIQCIGMNEKVSIVSSFFLIVFPEKTYSFADCGVVPDPNPEQLADIAISTAENHKKLTNQEPYVAMLSFSTKGSAKHQTIDKVIEAVKIIKSKKENLIVDGELQFDAAVIDSVARKKAPGSSTAGRANVLIFPDLNSGNIAYKIAQRWGKAEAVGPLIQGLKKPFFDLSRGCSVEDIVNNAAIAALMS